MCIRDRFKVISEISGVDEFIVEKGLNSAFSDFEDSLQYYCALQAKCSIITVSYTHLDVYKRQVLGQITRCDQAIKDKLTGVQVRHLLDRGHDDQQVFAHIDGLGSSFVIRAKASRNSDEFTLTAQGKPKPVKLLAARLDRDYTQCLLNFAWKGRPYPHSQMRLAQGRLTVGDKAYTVLRVALYDQSQKPIFSAPMLLVTNESCPDFQSCLAIYQAYLRRSKIESVFKFLKDNLGWESVSYTHLDVYKRQ